MFRREKPAAQPTFADQTRAAQAVPEDHVLMRMKRAVDWSAVERELFAMLNRQWERAGLISGKRRVLDGVHFWAKVARRSWVSLMREGRTLIVEAVEATDAARGAALRAEFVPPAGELEPRGEEALRVERERTAKLLAAVADIKDERVRERCRIVEAMLAERDRPVSFDDPDARWGHKGEDKPFLGYKAHEALDPDSRLITGVDVVAGNANEAVRTDELLERISDAFSYDAAVDQVACVEGKRSIGKARMTQSAGDLYYFSTADCGGCPRSLDCLTPGEREGKAYPRRRVYLADVRKSRIVAGEAGRAWRREHLRVRYRIEAKFDEQMNRHGLRHARYWGLAKVTAQVLFNALTVNLKRAAKLLAERAAGPPALAEAPA